MLRTITTTHRPATDLGYLLHKHPGRFQSYDLSFGKAHVFYPEASEDRCAACLLLDVDPVRIVRGKGSGEGLLDQYVNGRPYTASSFLSVAVSQVFSSALQGRCKDRPDLAAKPMPISASIEVLLVRGGEKFLRALSRRATIDLRRRNPLGGRVGQPPNRLLPLPGVGEVRRRRRPRSDSPAHPFHTESRRDRQNAPGVLGTGRTPVRSSIHRTRQAHQ